MAKKGATKSGGGSKNAAAKDSANAARMKAAGVRRTSARCPVCNVIVSLSSIYNHISVHS